ncbi:dienelactone hydrolase family protein [soil metagenome]
MNADPHRGLPVLHAGAALEEADVALVLLHGRGASPEDILPLLPELIRAGDMNPLPKLAALAPRAGGGQWYPYSFMAPVEQNQPYLNSALRVVEDIVYHLEQTGFPTERIVLGGFSQGACLATEFVARNPRRWGGLLSFSGGLIGPVGGDLTTGGDLAGMPAYFGCAERDPHIPAERVSESVDALREMGAEVNVELFAGSDHTVRSEELAAGAELLAGLATRS